LSAQERKKSLDEINPDAMYTLREAEPFIGRTPYTLKVSYIHEGKLEAVKHGRPYMLKGSEIIRFVNKVLCESID
jgi:hypothetical protein